MRTLENTNAADSLPFLEMPMEPWLSPHLRASLQHAMQSSGGGFRAKLVAAVCCSCHVDTEKSRELGTALEYFHLASLILDDLPCMDDAETRRGLPCTHKVYGESMALLGALTLINRAYFHVWSAACGSESSTQGRVNELLDQCLGLNGILNGQALDLKFMASDGSSNMIERIALLKTGSLLRLSIMLPAVIGGLDSATLKSLKRLSGKWGCAYQLLDDLKDIEWSEEASGKTPRRDALMNRPNLALSLGRDEAVERLRGHFQDCREILSGLVIGKSLEPFQLHLEKAGEVFLNACAA